jgi:hypothetical protein
MGKLHIVAMVAVILVGFGAVKLFVPTAGAEVPAIRGVGMDISRLHEGKNLPVQKIDDMTFVFSDAD